jgi:hypothetical protein
MAIFNTLLNQLFSLKLNLKMYSSCVGCVTLVCIDIDTVCYSCII